MVKTIIYCSKCGEENSDDLEFCKKCNGVLRNNNFIKLESLDTFSDIFTKENGLILKNVKLADEEYNFILETILNHGIKNLEKFLSNFNEELEEMPILMKIQKIVLSYIPFTYKSRGAELGSYAFNLINLDDRLDDSQQIATLIHELTHHLVSEIFEQILMYLLEVKKSDALEAYVTYALNHFEDKKIMNEYCAHTVEGRFIPHGYQNYGSFNALLSETNLSDKVIIQSLIYGNTLAGDIINILEVLIPESFRNEIKNQYKKDFTYPPAYDQILLEKKEIFENEKRNELLLDTLYSTFNGANSFEVRSILNDIKEVYVEINEIERKGGFL